MFENFLVTQFLKFMERHSESSTIDWGLIYTPSVKDVHDNQKLS